MPTGESLLDLRKFDNQDLEARHDYIQYMFPSPEPSGANPDAPVATIEDANAFAENQKLKDELLLNLNRMLIFWDFEMESGSDGSIKFSLSKKFNSKKAKQVILRNNSKFHNFLRLTRVVKSLFFLGLPQYAYAFQLFLLDVVAGQVKASDTTIEYWRTAIPVASSVTTENTSGLQETTLEVIDATEGTAIIVDDTAVADESSASISNPPSSAEHSHTSSGILHKAEGLISSHVPHLEKLDTSTLMHESKPLLSEASSLITDHDPAKQKEDRKRLLATANKAIHEVSNNSDSSTVAEDEVDHEHQHINSSHLPKALKSEEKTCERVCCVLN